MNPLDIVGTAAAGGMDIVGSFIQNQQNKRAVDRQMEFQNASNREAMAFERESAREAMDFSRQSAQDQMAFQERMSNSAWQRGMADMKAAGLNPMLAFGQGGASSPSGASASGSSASGKSSSGASYRSENMLSGAVNSALSSRRLFKDIQEADSRISVNESLKDLQDLQGSNLAANAAMTLTELTGKQNVEKFEKNWPGLTGFLGSLLKYLAPLAGSARNLADVGDTIRHTKPGYRRR